jgi:hypothetical protein
VTLIDDRIKLDNGREYRFPGIYDFHRKGEIIEYKLPFDLTREIFTQRTAALSFHYWKIWRVRGAHCSLDSTRRELSLPAGVFRSAKPITQVAQVETHFLLFYREGVSPSPIDCVTERGVLLWTTERTYLAMEPIPNSSDFTTDDMVMTRRYSAATGELLRERTSR